MGATEELLMSMEEAFVEATVNDGSETVYCTVDDDTRLVTIAEKYKKLGSESDEKAKRVWFRFPKMVGNNRIDLSSASVRVKFLNANGDGDIYIVKDLTVDGDYVVFSWELSRMVTAYKGKVGFVVCAVKSSTDGTTKNEWNTTLNKECEVLEGLKVNEQIVQENPDIIEYILANLGGSVSAGQIAAAVEEYMTAHPFNETDPTVPGWAKNPTKPTYTADEVGAVKAPSSNGTSGQILQTNGDGTTQWADVSTKESNSIVITPEQYGAVGDGKADDTDAIKKAIQAVANSGGGIVLMRKEYLVTSTITLALNVILEGISKFASIIMRAQEASAVYAPGLNKHTGIKNLSIRGNFNVSSHSSMKRSYIGLQIGKPDADKSADENALYYSVFENVMIYGFGTGLDVNLYSWTLFAKGFRIEKCFHGMWNYSTDNSFEDFAITGCYGDGLHIQYSGNCKYRNFFVERNGQQKQALGNSGEDVTTYYGVNYRGGENDIFSGITLMENHGHGFFCQYARNCYLDGIFAEMNGYYKYLNSGATLETKGIEFKLCKGVFGYIYGRNHDSNNPSQDKLFSTESCENMSIFYAEQNVPKASTYSGTNVRFLSNADIANLGAGGSSGGSGTEKSWYSGKKVVCYGTSITEQGQSISKWMSNIAKVLGCSMDNQGHGGYRVVNYMDGDLSTMPMLKALPTDGSVYLFEGGINDWRNTEIKVSTGSSSFMSFKDALQRIATYMLTNMPKALHLWFTPHYCLTMVDGTATDTVSGETLEDYANAMIDVAKKNGIPCVDMYHLCGWRRENISTFVGNENGAYIHPNADGGIRMSALILNELKRIEPMTDYTVNGSESGGSGSGGGESGGSGTSEGLPSDVLLAPTSIGITQNGTFTNYTELSGGEITKISDTNYKLNLTAGSGKYLAIETGTADNIRLAVKKISGALNATLYHATSLTAANGTINTLADSYGDIQTPLACNNGTGIILVSVTQAINAEIYVFKGNSYTGSSTTDGEKKQIENTFTT